MDLGQLWSKVQTTASEIAAAAEETAARAYTAVEETGEEMTHVAVVPREPRLDEPEPCLPRDEVLALAPAADGETIRVPPVIDGEGAA